MTDRRESPDPESAAGLSVLRRACIRYGLFGALVSFPFAVAGVPLGMRAAVGAFAAATTPHLIFGVMAGAFLVWTFVAPAAASLFLLRAAWSIRQGGASGPRHFLRAYRLLRAGCVFSFMPFLTLSGLWGSALMISVPGFVTGHWPARPEAPLAVWSLTALAVGYYVAFFRLRKLRDRLFVRRCGVRI